MSLRNEENKLFEKWKKSRDIKNFARDGAGKDFEKQPLKIICIGKETNGTDESWDWRERLDDGVFYKNGKPIEIYNLYRWVKFLLDGPLTFEEYEKVEKDREKRKEIFSKIAFMNLKKESGGSKTNDKQLQEAIRKDKEFIKRQLNLYLDNDDKKIIFILGDGLYTHIADILGDEVKKAKKILLNNNDRFIKKINDNLYIVKFYHFSAIKSNEEMYELIKKVKEEIDK